LLLVIHRLVSTFAGNACFASQSHALTNLFYDSLYMLLFLVRGIWSHAFTAKVSALDPSGQHVFTGAY